MTKLDQLKSMSKEQMIDFIMRYVVDDRGLEFLCNEVCNHCAERTPDGCLRDLELNPCKCIFDNRETVERWLEVEV